MHGIYAQLTWEDLCCMAFCYSNVFGVVVFNAHMLNWLGVYLTSIYRHCPRSSSGCSGMQGICAQLTLEFLCCMAFCYSNVFGVVVFNAHMLDWLRVYLTSIYRHCPRSSSGCSNMQGICGRLTGEGHMKCNGIQGIYTWLTGGSICLLYTCIVLDLIVGVTVCKTSVLYSLGSTYAGLHCAMLIYLV